MGPGNYTQITQFVMRQRTVDNGRNSLGLWQRCPEKKKKTPLRNLRNKPRMGGSAASLGVKDWTDTGKVNWPAEKKS